jgi:hypothetical protein
MNTNTNCTEPVKCLDQVSRERGRPVFPFLPSSSSIIKITGKEGDPSPAPGVTPTFTTRDEVDRAIREIPHGTASEWIRKEPIDRFEDILTQVDIARRYFRDQWLALPGGRKWKHGRSGYWAKHRAENPDGRYRGYVSTQAAFIAAQIEGIKITRFGGLIR